MQYESQIKKVLKITEAENQTMLDIQKLRKITWMPRPANFRKQVGVISLCKGFSPQTGTTTPDGFVSPLVTVMAGIPTITPPPLIIPVLLDFMPIGDPIVLPSVTTQTSTTLLLVATTDNETVAPGSADEAAALNITVTRSDTGVPLPLEGTPTFVAPGVVSIPISANETDVGGTSPSLTINFLDFAANVIGTAISIPLSAPTTVQAPIAPPDVNINSGALSASPIGNGLTNPIITKMPITLTNLPIQMTAPVIQPVTTIFP